MNYGYDSLYRLTNETVAGDPHNINGAVNYTYDSVGNRKQITSTLGPVPAGLFNYDANDRFTAGDTYDNDGNTISSGGIANVYDFENHLVQKGGVTIVYDGDGNRVSKAVAGVTTTYLVDSLNPTGYSQVVYETYSGSSAPNRELNHVYVYGLELLGQTRNYVANSQSNTQQIYYDYDGHGSVRALTDPNGVATDTYDYDAFGNLIHSTGSTPNNYLFAGEQFDPDLGLYYNRARYLNVSTGRFWSMDAFESYDGDGAAYAHRYVYASADPVNGIDPSGEQTEVDEEAAITVEDILQGLAVTAYVAYSTGILNASGGEPDISRRDRLENPGKWLYAFGNTQGPSGPRIDGLKPGQLADLLPDANGLVGPYVPPLVQGASTWSNPETAKPTGQVWKTEKQGIEATPGLGVWADGSDAVPPGPQLPGHHTVYPTIGMKPDMFIWLFKSQPWRYVYNKKVKVNIS